MPREEMVKHRGFPGRLAGTDFQFTLRRANPRGVTPIVARERHADRRAPDRRADLGFMLALWEHFGDEPFVRVEYSSACRWCSRAHRNAIRPLVPHPPAHRVPPPRSTRA